MGRIQNTIAIPIYRVLPYPVYMYIVYTHSPHSIGVLFTNFCCIKHVQILLQVNKKFCELKGGHIGIVEKAQETIFGISPKYSRYIGIAS